MFLSSPAALPCRDFSEQCEASHPMLPKAKDLKLLTLLFNAYCNTMPINALKAILGRFSYRISMVAVFV